VDAPAPAAAAAGAAADRHGTGFGGDLFCRLGLFDLDHRLTTEQTDQCKSDGLCLLGPRGWACLPWLVTRAESQSPL
jgi:hypothetical protein